MVTAVQTTIPISVNALPADVRSALETLTSIGTGNVTVTGTPGTYHVTFGAGLGNHLMAGATDSLRSNGVHAIITLDGGAGNDHADVNLIGGRTASTINVFDTGPSSDADTLTINGPDPASVFLLRAATSDRGLAFVALINGPTPLTPAETDPVERVNYNTSITAITLNGGHGDDQFYVDDTRAAFTINMGEGNDLIQIGQLYKSRRTPDLAGVAPQDVFATIDTTQGWLSNGVSSPMTVNGGSGDKTFIVFHNLDTLQLNGYAGTNTFIIQAFALTGSQEDHRALTDLTGGAGQNLIEYAVDAPVNIDGGSGYSTVVVIGTEFNDDFVVTPHGVFGAGLNVNFVNIKAVEIDGGAGNDRFFVLGTNPNWTTTVTGGKGSKLISVMGPTPANGVISNDLLGHSGIITHTVSSTGPNFAGINVDGISANVADKDTPGVVVTETGGYSQVVQRTNVTDGFDLTKQTQGEYAVRLTRPPDTGNTVTVRATPPTGLAILSGGVLQRTINSEAQVVSLAGLFAGHFTLQLDANTPTDPISWDATAAVVQAALEKAGVGIGAGNVKVEQDGSTYTMTFQNGTSTTRSTTWRRRSRKRATSRTRSSRTTRSVASCRPQSAWTRTRTSSVTSTRH